MKRHFVVGCVSALMRIRVKIWSSLVRIDIYTSVWHNSMLSCDCVSFICFFFSSRRRHTRFDCDWSSDVCSSDLRELYYHLAVPRLYLEHHRVLELPFFQAYHVRNLEMLFTWIMALGGAEAIKFAVFALSLAAAAASYALGSLVFSKRAGLWAAALFYTTPLVGWESSTVYIDTIIALFVACAFIAIAWWFDTRRPQAR